MELRSDCQLRVKKFISNASYKLAPFLSSANKQLQFTKETNRLGAELKEMLDMELDEINDKTVEGLKRISKAEVGISVKRRVADTRVDTGVKEVVTTLRTSRKCDNEVTKKQATGDALAPQRAKQELKTARAAYFSNTLELSANRSRKCRTKGGGGCGKWTQLKSQRCYTQ